MSPATFVPRVLANLGREIRERQGAGLLIARSGLEPFANEGLERTRGRALSERDIDGRRDQRATSRHHAALVGECERGQQCIELGGALDGVHHPGAEEDLARDGS